MQPDALRPLLDQIEQRCQQKGIEVFYGAIEAHLQTTVQWNKTGDGDWEQFLKVLCHAGGKILIVSTGENDIDTGDADLLDYLNDLPQELQQEFREALNVVEKTTGQLASFTLTFFHGSIQFELHKTAHWYEAYCSVKEAYEVNEEEEDEEEEDSDLSTSPESMSPEEIEQWARKIIHHSTYLSSKDRMQRNRAAAEFCEREGLENSGDTYKILRKAELLFEEEVQPTREQELSRQVKALKEKGLKKVEVQSKLGISARTLNRHWY